MANRARDSAKEYSSLKYALSILDTAYLLVLLVMFLGFGLSKSLVLKLLGATNNYFAVIAVYLLIVSVIYYLLSFPLNFYRSYVLEHKFSLSNQKIKDWLKDQIKVGILSYAIAFILISAFYYTLRHFIHAWWFIASLLWIFFSLVLARLAPVIIIPLFFKYKKLSDENLRERIIRLSDKMRVKILDVFEIDFSKKTLKANAGFVGWGATRRVILADTLKDKYSYDEIEVILAHEFSHYRQKHLLKLIFVNASVIIATFFILYKTSDYFLARFLLRSLWDIASLPLVLIYFIVLGLITQPLENYISRRFEKEADMEAIKVTGLKDAFISMMEKLSEQNLADRNPHPIIKHLFFDHPPVEERIALARQL
jgi:STE24 endopeptidase